MMYMAGNAISIFPIMMVAMMAWRPMRAIVSVNQAFKPLEVSAPRRARPTFRASTRAR